MTNKKCPIGKRCHGTVSPKGVVCLKHWHMVSEETQLRWARQRRKTGKRRRQRMEAVRRQVVQEASKHIKKAA